jgi:CHAD domain-containing protein
MLSARSQLIRKHLDRFASALNGAAKGDPRALHRTRVASRRLRELIPLLQLDHDVARKLGRRLRKVTRRLGLVRELDVLVLLIDELRVSRREHSQALGRIAVAVSKQRDDVRAHLGDRMPLDDARRATRRLARIVDSMRASEPEQPAGHDVRGAWRWAIDARMVARAARLSAAIVDAGAVYLPERLHAVRIAVKKLRYAVEMAIEAAAQPSTADLRTLKRAQATLGRLHDLQVLIDRIRQVQASLAPPSMSVWRGLDRLVTALENDCRRLHARYMRQRVRLEALAAHLSAHPESSHDRIAEAPVRRHGRTRSTPTASAAAPRRTIRALDAQADGRSTRRPVAV